MRIVTYGGTGGGALQWVLVWGAVCAAFHFGGLAVVQSAETAAPDAAAPSGRWRVLPVDQTKRRDDRWIRQVLQRGTLSPADTQQLDEHYRQYALPRWTLPENRDRLVDFRKALRSDLDTAFRYPASKDAYHHLTDLVLQFMTDLITTHPTEGDCHPFVQVNAAETIGELNQAEATAGTVVPQPTPLPAALPVLLKRVQDPNELEAVKVVCMHGIIRHAKLGGIRGTPQEAEVIQLMTSLLQGPADDLGSQWLQAQAAVVLGQLKSSAGPVGEVLAGMVENGSLCDYARCSAASALGTLDYADAASLDLSRLAVSLGKLALEACAEAYNQVKLGRPLDRRRLKTHLRSAAEGLAGLNTAATAAGPPHVDFVASVKKTVDAMLAPLNSWRPPADPELQGQLNPHIRKLQQLLANSTAS